MSDQLPEMEMTVSAPAEIAASQDAETAAVTAIAPPTIVVAMLGVVVVGLILVLINWAAPVLTPVMMAAYLAALCAPLYMWLQGRGVNQRWAIILLVVVVVVAVLGVAGLLILSVNRLTEGLISYQGQLGGAESQVRAVLTDLGLEEGSLRNMLDGDTLTTILVAILGFIADFAGDLLFSVVLIAFLLLESRRFVTLARTKLSDRPFFSNVPEIAQTAVTYFGVRTQLNLLTGIGITLLCFVLGVDYAVLWGVLAFIMSYIPYVGLVVAGIPPTILALGEHGFGRAAAVVVGIIIINLAAENILEPRMTGKALKLSATVVLLSFFFWGWLLGSTGALLSMPITVMIMLVASQYDQTRWVADLMGSQEGSED
jgi:predicted PurR-regulated permease PerM